MYVCASTFSYAVYRTCQAPFLIRKPWKPFEPFQLVLRLQKAMFLKCRIRKGSTASLLLQVVCHEVQQCAIEYRFVCDAPRGRSIECRYPSSFIVRRSSFVQRAASYMLLTRPASSTAPPLLVSRSTQ